jgi:SAM-dependent methyltransferase
MQPRAFGLAIAIAAGCSHVPAPPPVAPAAPPSERMIIELSHAALDAYDRGDLATLRDQLAPGFVRFDSEKLHTLDQELAKLAKKPAHPPSATRQWREDHAYVRANDAVFIGLSVEHETGNEVHGNREDDGWYTMSWIRDGDRWRIAHWTWQRHHTELDNERDSWNQTFASSLGFNHQPNRLLVGSVAGQKPGRALDVMMGQGRNAVYLATQGWKVTGIDISTEGLRLARQAAAEQHVPLDAVEADADHYEFGTDRWDLVTMIYAGDDSALLEKLKPSVAHGGLFVAESFLAGPTSCCGGWERGALTKAFSGGGWDILRDEVVDDVPDWATNRATLVRFVARRK